MQYVHSSNSLVATGLYAPLYISRTPSKFKTLPEVEEFQFYVIILDIQLSAPLGVRSQHCYEVPGKRQVEKHCVSGSFPFKKSKFPELAIFILFI